MGREQEREKLKEKKMAAVVDVQKELIKGIIHIARHKEFFGHVIQQFQKVYVRNPHHVDTAAVGRFPGERFIKMWMNLDYVSSLYEKNGKDAWNYVLGLEEHEILHLVCGHLSLKFDDRVRGNVAVDCAVNSHLPDNQIHKSWITPQLYGLPKDKAAVWYYNNLKDNKTFKEQLGSGAFGIGGILEYIGKSHKGWEEAEKDPLTKEFVKDVLRKSKELSNKNYGNIPSSVVEMIEDLLRREKALIPWGRVLRMFCASAQESTLEYTMSRESKRFGTRPGTRKGDVLNLAVCIDTSGSISNDQLKTFFNEIKWIWKNGAMVTVVEADCEVQQTYKFNGKFKGEVHGRGGTDLEPALKQVEGKYDACIYFTDFCAPRISRRYRIPTLWVLTDDMDESSYPATWGRRIKLEPKESK
jgi:predicted metal-dependent peptidase